MSGSPEARSGLAQLAAAGFTSAAVLELLGLTWPVRPVLAVALLGAAVVTLAVWCDARPRREWRDALAEAMLLAAAAALLPGLWRWLSLAASLGGVVDRALVDKTARWARGSRALFGGVCTTVLCALPVAAGSMLLAGWALRDTDVTALAGPVAGALHFLGLDATAFEGQVALTTLHGVSTVPMSLTNIGAYSALALWLGLIGLRVSGRDRPAFGGIAKLAGLVALGVLAALILAFTLAFQAEVFLNFDSKNRPVGFFADPTFRTLILVLVLAPLFAAFANKSPAMVVAKDLRARPGRRARQLVALGVLALAFGWFATIEEPGHRKPGRILIDEQHSQWESVRPHYDTEWYGFDSGYNYAAVADYLSHFYQVTPSYAALDDSALRDVDVLIVKTPTRAYRPEEVRAVLDFVARGGGLLLIGEHTNVWGSGYYLNALAKPLGFEFRYDVVFDLRSKFEERYQAPRLGTHPVLRGVNDFLFEVSCSAAPEALTARPAMWAGGLWSLGIDYAVSNFYPTPDLTFGARVGPHAQCVTRHYGRGRVAGFTDSTVWSNFSALLPGKPELLLGLIEWLDRRNRFPDPYGAAPWLLIAALAGAALLRWRRSGSDGLLVAGVLLGGLLGCRLAEFSNRSAYRPPAGDSGLERVAFVSDTTAYDLPIWGFVRRPERSYAIFYQWVLRLGLFPAVTEEGERPPAGTRVVVRIVGPAGVTPAAWAGISRSLERGTPVLLLLQINAGPNVSAALRPLGLGVTSAPPELSPRLRVAGNGALWTTPWRTAQRLEGGVPLLSTASGRIVLARANGAPLYVMVGTEQFTDNWMGEDQGNTPDEGLRRQFELEFSLFRGLAHGGIEGELAVGATRPLRVSPAPPSGVLPLVDRPGQRRHGG